MIARSRFPLSVLASGDCHNARASWADNQFPKRTPSFLSPFTRRMPAANSGLSKPASAASYANRRTAANLTLIVPGAKFRDSKLMRYRSTTVRLNERRGSEQYHSIEFVDGMCIPTLRFWGPKAANHGGLGLIEVRQAQSCFRFSDLSLFRFSSHAKPPPNTAEQENEGEAIGR